MYGLVLEQGGASGTNEQSVEVLRNTYIMAGKQFPFVIIPEWYYDTVRKTTVATKSIKPATTGYIVVSTFKTATEFIVQNSSINSKTAKKDYYCNCRH